MTSKMSRREHLALTASACATLALISSCSARLQGSSLITRPIPSTGERLPIIGLGSAAAFWTFDAVEIAAIRAVMQVMIDSGGTVFDTAPDYLTAEEVAGSIVKELGVQNRMFWATKLPTFRGGAVDREVARARLTSSFERLGREQIDLVQVINIEVDAPLQFSFLKEVKEQGKVRYIGAVATAKSRYEALERYMRTEPLDFIGVDYAVNNRSAEERLLRLAHDKGIAVMGYVPFREFRDRVKGLQVPGWAAEFGATTWAQFCLKFAASHPAVTVVTPATSDPQHMRDNMEAARGRLPDEAERRRMIEFVDALPA